MRRNVAAIGGTQVTGDDLWSGWMPLTGIADESGADQPLLERSFTLGGINRVVVGCRGLGILPRRGTSREDQEVSLRLKLRVFGTEWARNSQRSFNCCHRY